MRRFKLSLLGVLALSSCDDKTSKEPKPWEKSVWEEVSAPPEWVRKPEAEEGFVRFVDGGSSWMASLAYSFEVTRVRSAMELQILWRLRPALGTGADGLDLSRLPAPRFVKRAMYVDYSRTSGEAPVGKMMHSAWILWDIPKIELLGILPEDMRETAKQTLDRCEPTTTPKWEDVEGEPAWVQSPSQAESDFSVVTKAESDSQGVAQANADVSALATIAEIVARRLGRTVATASSLPSLGRLASTWAVLKARVSRSHSGNAMAWMHWQIRLEPILEKFPLDQRTGVRDALRKQP